ncbi:MAG: thioredoxin domain-containing protein, partial [Rhodospirillales bacterium]
QANLLIDGRWRHCWSRIDDDGQGTASQPAVLDDIAHLGRAALALHCATGESRWLDLALDCLDQADSHYRDRDGGGYFVSADDTADIIHRPKSALDNAVPSGNGVMADLIARTLLVTGDDSIRPRIDSLMTAFAGAPAGQHPHLTLLLMAQETNLNAETLVVVGATDPDHPLVRAAIDSAPERSVIQLAPAPETLPAGHPAQGKGLVAGKPTAYLCRQGTCSLPFTAPEALSETLLVL